MATRSDIAPSFAVPDQGIYQMRETLDLRRPTALPGLPQRTIDLAGLFR